MKHFAGTLQIPPGLYKQVESWLSDVEKSAKAKNLRRKLKDLQTNPELGDIEAVKELLGELEASPGDADLLQEFFDEWAEWAEESASKPKNIKPNVKDLNDEQRKHLSDKVLGWAKRSLKNREEAHDKEVAPVVQQVRNRIKDLGPIPDVKPVAQTKEFDMNLEGWKYLKALRNNAKKRGLDADKNIQKMPPFKVQLFNPESHGELNGFYDFDKNTLLLPIPGVRAQGGLGKLRSSDWRKALKHELQHLSQNLMQNAVGIQGKSRAPGMPSRHVGPSKSKDYLLEDREFHTWMTQAVDDFKRHQQKAGWNPQETRTAVRLYTGAKPRPDVKEWSKIDPNRKIRNALDQFPHEAFKAWKKDSPEKWKAATKELVKTVASPSSEQWREFLKEHGKTKVQNPNPKTRDRVPEITVNYLMRKTEPVYEQAQQRVRREFARKTTPS